MRNLGEYAKQCMLEIDNIGVKYGNIVEFKVNTRAKKRWGQCKTTPFGYIIEINPVLLDERNVEQGLKETIIHELLHTCSGCYNHGKTWNRLAEKVNKAYGYNIKRCSSIEEKGVQKETLPVETERKVKYIVTCDKCSNVCARRERESKVIKHPEHYRCSRCGGKLNVIKINDK